MLADLCSGLETAVEKLNPKDDEFAFDLRLLLMRFIKDAAVLVGDASNQYGEVPALLHCCHDVLIRLKTETDQPEERGHRYRRQQAVLNLMALCYAIHSFCSLAHFEQRKIENVKSLRDAVSGALGSLVSSDDETV